MNTLIERYDQKRRKKRIDKRPRWILLGFLAILIKVFASDAELVDAFYSSGIFQYIRSMFDFINNRLAFPLSYLIVPFLLFKIWAVYMRGWATARGCIGFIFNTLLTTVAVVAWLFFWFTILWGLNYDRTNVYDKLSLEKPEINSTQIYNELVQKTKKLSKLRNDLSLSSSTLTKTELPSNLVTTLQKEVAKTMKKLNYSPTGIPVVRELPSGWLLRWSTAGLYFPYTGEANIDAGLHPLQKPFTIAHELAHSYGIGDEATCNFIAYLTCKNSTDPIIQYTGLLAYWRYLASGYKRYSPSDYSAFKQSLPPTILADLEAIRINNEKYPDIFPKLRNTVYDNFLKSQGVSEGIESYGQVVELVYAYEK